MSDIGTLTAHIGLDTKDLERGSLRSQQVISQLGSGATGASVQFASMGATLSKVGAALGVAFGASQAIKFLRDSVTAAAESELAWNDLTQAIGRHGGKWLALEGQIKEFASGLQESFGVSDEAVAQSIQRFVDYGMNTTTAMEMVESAMDLAAGAHVDLDSAVKAIARGYAGNTMLLQRLTGVTEEAADGTEKFANVMTRLRGMFGGAAEAQIGSMTVKLRSLGEAFKETSEAFGKLMTERAKESGLIDVLDRLKTNALAIAKQIESSLGMKGKITELKAMIAELDSIQVGRTRTVGFGTSISDALKIFSDQLSVSTDAIAGQRKRLEAELISLLGLQEFGKMIAGVSSETLEDLTNLKENLLRGIGTVGDMSSLQAGEDLQKQLKADADEAKRLADEITRAHDEYAQAWESNVDANILKQEDVFQERMRQQQENATIANTFQPGFIGPPTMGQLDIEAYNRSTDEAKAKAKEITDALKQQEQEAADFAIRMGSRVVDAMVDVFTEGRANMAAIWKAMFSDFMRYFYEQLVKKLTLKVASAILNTAAPGTGTALEMGANAGGAFGDWTPDVGTYGKPVVDQVPILGRLASPESRVQMVVITPPMSVNQDYVRKVVIPELQRLRASGVAI